MLIKCPFDTYAYYDAWGDRYLLFDEWEYWRAQRWVAQLEFLVSFAA